ncbi:terpene synthase family protein [Nocardia wallacei]|uniref:Terpene synthase n=1 Tax=Nocardia wallacei TaxID=480035 RepID=A0A7G1KQ03_9NOCA|nr:hypothetical protein [Nocardia wallacei]BCK56273.1 hypothetical protein NWFMUON74_40450 [Nocardia wallacei]
MATNVSEVELPRFYCPLESVIHPHAEEAERRALTWIDASGICTTAQEFAAVRGTRGAEFFARFAPAADPDRLWLAAAWVYWGFAFDDARCDEEPYNADPAAFAAMAAGIQRALEIPGPAHFDDPYEMAIHDLGNRLRTCATPVQMRRFIQNHRAWLTGVQWQIGNAARNHMPNLNDYISMRLHSAGGEPTFALLEIVNGREIPAVELDSPVVSALTEMAILVAALDNDRHSLRKEAMRGQTDQNIFNVLANQYGYSLAEASREAIALRDRVLVRFLQLREEIMSSADPPLASYLDDLGHGIRGNAEWGQRVIRYRTAEHGDELAGGAATPVDVRWACHPASTDPAPIALPTINWWWDEFSPPVRPRPAEQPRD